jgi:hypothetical protein
MSLCNSCTHFKNGKCSKNLVQGTVNVVECKKHTKKQTEFKKYSDNTKNHCYYWAKLLG